MAIYDNLPYTNFHELNRRWLVRQADSRKAKIEEFKRQLEQFEEDYNTLLGLANAMTATGNNVTVAGSLTANGLIGNLTGNVTGNLTGNVTGDVTGDVTGGSFQGSYVEATNGQITHDLTVGNDAEIFNNLTVDGTIFGNVTGNVSGNAATATHATSADSATSATSATRADLANSASEANVAKSVAILTTISSHDMNDFVNSSPDKLVAFYNGTAMTTNVPAGWENDDVTVMVITFKSTIIIQIAMFSSTVDLFVRSRISGTWGSWNAIAFDA